MANALKWRPMNYFQYGNKAALIVGILLMIADSVFPEAHQYSAWPVGCLFCVWYSASAIREDPRVRKNLKKWLYIYLAVVFVGAIALRDAADTPAQRADRAIPSVFKALGIGGRS